MKQDHNNENDKIYTSAFLKDVVGNFKHDNLKFVDIMSSLETRGFAIPIIIFILPLAIPIPYPPGFASVIILPTLLFSIQMLMGKKYAWLPKRIGNKTIKRKTVALVIEKSCVFLDKIEKLLRNRFDVFSSNIGQRVFGGFVFIFSICIILPLPLSNLLPSIGILIMSLGLLGRDGVVVITGIMLGIIGVILTTLVVFFGMKVIYFILPFLSKVS